MYWRNLWQSIVALGDCKNAVQYFLQIDRIVNSLAGGHPLATVSGRVGYFAHIKRNSYWLALQKVIDECFRPWEGRGHCWAAYLWEQKNPDIRYRRSSDIALAALSVFVLLGCLLICIPIYLYGEIAGRR